MCAAARARNRDDDPYPTRTTQRVSTIARVEPTVWSRTADGPLSEPELLFYDTHGYLCLPAFVDRRHVALLRAAADELHRSASGLDFDIRVDPETNACVSIGGAHRDGGHFEALMTHHPGITGAARQILADDVVALESRLDWKPGFDGRGTPWRSDFEAWHHDHGLPSMRALSVHLFLTSVRACNGPMLVIPGSHRVFLPCADDAPNGTHAPDRDAIRTLEHTHGVDVLPGGPGTVVFADANLLHAAGNNPAPHDCITFVCAYNAVSNTRDTEPPPGDPA